MQQVALGEHDDLEQFRRIVRYLLASNIDPDAILWTDGDAGLPPSMVTEEKSPVLLPAGYLALVELVICHSDRARLDRLYRLAWRLTHGERGLLHVAADPLVHLLDGMRKAVARDRHKMTAFVRFRRIEAAGEEHYVAWFEPQHFILRNVAPFFRDRFPEMRWTILTPLGTVEWKRPELRFGPPALRSAAPDGDPLDEMWQSYYAATFNPARANLPAMRAEMPKRYWHNLPEAKLVPALLAKAREREITMLEGAGEPAAKRKEQPMSIISSLGTLAEIAEGTRRCTRCPLYRNATQGVPGAGDTKAELVLVGEQPGDQEDLAGLPFVGPAGQMLDRALVQAGLDRQRLYVTNAVKHFKFEPRGKRRIHQKPSNEEIEQCRWWLDQELALINPRLVVALGATAARALLRRSVTIGKERGRLTDLGEGSQLLVTVHPSFLLRLPDQDVRQLEFRKFTADLMLAAQAVPLARLAA